MEYDSKDRDASLKLIDWFDVKRVRAARMLVVGAGAIGNEVLKNLALLGIGNVFVLDRDTVEVSNLSRSILFRQEDEGQPKAETVARAVQKISPNVDIRWKTGDIRFDLGLGMLRRMHVVIGGLDNVMARYTLNRLCWQANRPWCDAGIGVLDGQVAVYRPDNGACYECYFTSEQHREVALPCNVLASRYASEGKVPTTPTMASIAGGVLAQEALKMLNPDDWEKRTLVSRKFKFQGTLCDSTVINLQQRRDCDVHSMIVDESKIIEMPDLSAYKVTVEELLDKIRTRFGETAFLKLNFDIAVEYYCKCNKSHPVLKPVQTLKLEDLGCKVCGVRPMNRSDLECETSIDGKQRDGFGGRRPLKYLKKLLKSRLIEIGIPPLDILEIGGVFKKIPAPKKGKRQKSGEGLERVEVYIELTGDMDADFGFNAL